MGPPCLAHGEEPTKSLAAYFLSKAVLAVLCIYYTYIIWCDSIQSIDGNHREMMAKWMISLLNVLATSICFFHDYFPRVLSRNFEFPDFDTDFRGEKRSCWKGLLKSETCTIKSYEFNLSHNPFATCNYRTDFFTYLMVFCHFGSPGYLAFETIVLPDTIPSWLLLSWILEFVYMSFQEPNMYIWSWFCCSHFCCFQYSVSEHVKYTCAFVR